MKKNNGLTVVAVLLLVVSLFWGVGAPAFAQPAPAAGDIPKIQYVKGLVLSEEAMAVDPARAQRGLGATLI